MAITGGQVLIDSLDNAASAIALTTNVGTTETIVIPNTLGDTDAAITLDAKAGGIELTTADKGVMVTTATFQHKAKYYSISAGAAATEIRVGGGTGLLCVGLEAGAAEIGTTEGYASVGDDEDFLRFSIALPDDFVDTGTAADLLIEFDVVETAAEICNIGVRIFEYDGFTANTTAIIDDALAVADDGTRTAMKKLVTGVAGVGNAAELQAGDVLIFELTSVADADDFDIYGIKLSYRVGLTATE